MRLIGLLIGGYLYGVWAGGPWEHPLWLNIPIGVGLGFYAQVLDKRYRKGCGDA